MFSMPLSTVQCPMDTRFWSKVDASGDCWEWRGRVADTGYGTFGQDYAHRMAWEFLVTPIPYGLQIDHLCRNRSCVNPDHLEPVTQKVNAERGIKAKKVYCKRGHRLSGDNLSPAPTRKCRACHNARARKYRARQS